MPSPIVTAYMDIVPTTKGLRGNVARQLGADADKVGQETGRRAGDTAGEEAGKRTGRGIAGGIAKSAGIIGAAVAGLAIGDQIMKSITGAGDLEQSVGAIDTVFKGNADQMHAWADTAAQSVGLSKNAYNEFGTLIGSQLKNAGIPMDDIAGKTNEMITLGADMSSMFGGDTSEAVEALSSALKGERDPIERYGVTLTQASIEAKAMEMGLISAGGEMDKNAETAATLALITDQTADAQGNFGRESGTLQGQLQRTNASWENMRTEIGMKVLPILTRVVQFGNDELIPGVAAIGRAVAGAARGVAEFVSGASVEDSGLAGFIGHVKEAAVQLGSWVTTTGIPAMQSLWQVVGPVLTGAFRTLGDVLGWVVNTLANVGSVMLQFRGTIGSIALVVGSMVAAWKAYRLVMTIVTAVQAAWTAVMVGARAAMAAFRAIVVFGSLAMRAFNLSLLANPIGLVVVAITGLVAGFVLAYKRIGWFKDGVDALWAGLKAFGSWVGTFFTQTVWPALQSFFSWAGGAFRNLGNIAVSIWRGIGGAASGFLSWITGTLWPGLQAVLGAIGQGFRGMGSAVVGVWRGIRAAASGFVGWFTGTLWPGIQTALGWIGSGFRGMGNVAGAVFRGIVAAAQWWWAGVKITFTAMRGGLQWVGDKFTWFRNWVNAIFTRVRDFLALTVAQIRTVAFAVLRAGLQWVGDKFTWFRMWATSMFTRVRDFLAATAGRIRAVVFGPLRSGLQWVGDKFSWFRMWATSMFTRLRDALFRAGAAIRAQTFDRLKAALSLVGDRFSSVRSRISDIWGNLRQLLYDGYVAIRDKTLDPLREAARRVRETFTAVKDGIKTAWDGLKDAVKKPVVFVVDSVVNPFINAYNKANNFWNGKDIGTLDIGFARGGVLPGYQSAKRDDVMTPMRSGEGVLVPEVVRGLGASFVHAANKAGNTGGVQAVRKWAAEGFAKGGVVGSPLKGNYRISQYPNAAHLWAADIATPVGTPVYATADGTVTWAGPGVRSPGVWGGNEIHISGGGLERWFAHLSQIGVKKGQQVKKGDRIGSTGNTGISSGPHLHFGVFRGGWPNAVNALDYLGGAFKFDPNAPVGGGGSSWTDPIQWVKDKIMGVFDFVNPIKRAQSMFEGNSFLELGTGLFGKLKDGVIEKASQLADPIINAVDAVKNSGVGKRVAEKGNQLKVEAWVTEALRATDQWGIRRFNKTVQQAYIESGGDPNARNETAAGKAAGGPVGLMQTIPSTFNAYAMPGRTNILDPVDNTIAAIRYVIDKYGGIENIWPTKAGYALGGIIPTLFDGGGWLSRDEGQAQIISHRTRTPDAVLSSGQWRDIHSLAMQRGPAQDAGSREYHFHGVGPTEDPEHYARRSSEMLAHTLRKAGKF